MGQERRGEQEIKRAPPRVDESKTPHPTPGKATRVEVGERKADNDVPGKTTRVAVGGAELFDEPAAPEGPRTTPNLPAHAPPTVPSSTIASIPPSPTLTVSQPRAHVSSARMVDGATHVTAKLGEEHAKLDGFYAGANAETLAAAASQASEITAAAATRHAQYVGAIAQRASFAHSTFSVVRANMLNIALTQSALARSDARGAVDRLREDNVRQRADAHEAAKAQGARMNASAKREGANIGRSGAATRTALSQRVNDSIQDAQQIEDAGDRSAVTAALRGASSSAREKITDRDLADHDALVGVAAKNETTFIHEGDTLFGDRDKHLAKVERGILDAGEQLASHFSSVFQQQIIVLAQAEMQYISRLSTLKSSASAILSESAAAARKVATLAQIHSSQLRAGQAASHGALDSTAHRANALLQKQRVKPAQMSEAATVIASELGKLGAALHAEATTTHGTGLTGIEGISALLGGTIEERIARMNGQLDAVQSKVTQGLTDASAGMLQQFAADRAKASGLYAQVFTQFSVPSWGKVLEAKGSWSVKADEFETAAAATASKQIATHRRIVSALPEKLGNIKAAAIKKRHSSWLSRNLSAVWRGFKAFVGGLLIAIAVIGLLLAFGVELAIAIAVVAIAGVVWSFVQRMRALIGAWGRLALVRQGCRGRRDSVCSCR